jgi:hypothetical protein
MWRHARACPFARAEGAPATKGSLRGHRSLAAGRAIRATSVRYVEQTCAAAEPVSLSQRDLTLRTARSRKRFIGVHILARPAIVRVGVSAANLPLSDLIKLAAEPGRVLRGAGKQPEFIGH